MDINYLQKRLGGVSGYNENGLEIGSVEINLEENAKNDKIFSKLKIVLKPIQFTLKQ